MAEGQNSPEIPFKIGGPKKGIVDKAMEALQELPLISAWRKEREFNSLGKNTVRKLLTDIKTGGIVMQPQPGRSQKYWVWLENDKRQSYVVTALIEPSKSWKDSMLYLEAADDNLLVNESLRSLTAEMNPSRDQGSTIPFSDAKWQGDIIFDVSMRGQQISKEEQIRFFRELLHTAVDEKRTQSEYSKTPRLASMVRGRELMLYMFR